MLLIACANVAGLLLARRTEREGELAAGITYVVQTGGSASAIVPRLREAVWAVDPLQTIYHSDTLEHMIAARFRPLGRHFRRKGEDSPSPLPVVLTVTSNVIRSRITMSKTVTVRELRNRFPEVRKLVEAEGEVVLTEKGEPRYRLTLYTPPSPRKAPPVDYWARLNSYQPHPMTEAQARALHDENRGDR